MNTQNINSSRIKGVLMTLIVIVLSVFILSPAAFAQAPSASTNSASDIGSHVAVLNGTVNANNAVTTVTFEYGTDIGYGGSFSADQSPVSGSTETAVSVTASELSPNTTYHFRVAALNVNGTTYGEDMTFTTAELPPTATTNAATNVDAGNATLNGLVWGRGFDTDVVFEYGITTEYGTTITANESPLLSPFNTFNFPVTVTLSGLSDNTTYHYRVAATNENGTTYGSDMTFTIGVVGGIPSAVTASASDIGMNSAVLNGSVNANDSETTVVFEYGPDTSYAFTARSEQSPVSGTSDTAVDAFIEELSPNTTYHFRVVAENIHAKVYGEDMTLTTLPMAPAAITGTATDIGASDATLNATVNARGAFTNVIFEYGPDTNYGRTVTAAESPLSSDVDTPVSQSISGLVEGITYHYRVTATNAGGTSHGQDKTFSLGIPAPTAVTHPATDISVASATLHGLVNANDRQTDVTFEYGPTTDYNRIVEASPSTVIGSEDTAVQLTIANLLSDRTYHFRVVASSDGGVSTGADRTFTTGSGPQVTTLSASDIGTDVATLIALVNPNNQSTTVTFEYGETAAYGHSISAGQNPVEGSTDTVISAQVLMLVPGTTYHYRAVGENVLGITYGTDQIFRTAALHANAPLAVTTVPTGISTTGATLTGNVTSNGYSTEVYFEYGLTNVYTDSLPASPSPVIGDFAVSVQGTIGPLVSDTTYHYRVVATNEFGTSFGQDMTFRTITPSLPTVVTEAASEVTTSTATLNGSVNAHNSMIYNIYFEYGTSTAYGQTVYLDPSTIGGTIDIAVSTIIRNLSSNTIYHYRLTVMTVSGGLQYIYGDDQSFSTGPTAGITVTTDSARVTGTTSTILYGSVNPGNTNVSVTFEYGPNTGYGRVIQADQSPVSGGTVVVVSALSEDLMPNVTYHFRTVALNSEGTSYGDDQTFTTLTSAPLATTEPATGVTGTTATMNGKVNAYNEVTTVIFQYGLTTDYGDSVFAGESPLAGNTLTVVNGAISGLTPNTEYHYRVMAENNSGVTYGADHTFFTGTTAPTAITGAASDISATSAKLNGTVIANNASTTITFEFGPDTSYGRLVDAEPNTVSGSINTEVFAQLTGLTANTVYHFRVVAQNNAGPAVGADAVFTTAGPVDSDGDGVADGTEGSADRDGDGIPDYLDYDPTGYFYDEADGRIIAGGQVEINGPGSVTILQDGSEGYYHFTTDGTAGIYTIAVTLPAEYVWSTVRLPHPGALDPSAGPNPLVLGFGENADTGYLASGDSSHFYLQFDLQTGDPVVFNNNFPIKPDPASAEDLLSAVPSKFALSQNYPNPFNPVTTIAYELPESGFVILSVYNVKGQLIKTLIESQQSPGFYQVHWDAGQVNSGIYFYRLSAGGRSLTGKMVLMK